MSPTATAATWWPRCGPATPAGSITAASTPTASLPDLARAGAAADHAAMDADADVDAVVDPTPPELVGPRRAVEVVTHYLEMLAPPPRAPGPAPRPGLEV